MLARVSIYGSPYGLEPHDRSLPPSLSLAGSSAVTGVLRSAKHWRCMADAVLSSPLTASVRIRISRCIPVAGKAREPTLMAASEKKSAGEMLFPALLRNDTGA
jgi:hypothetical protein